MKKVLLDGGTILDCTGAKPVADGAVLIDGDKIQAVGSKSQVVAPPDAEVIDTHGQTIMPGMINTHDHLAHWDPDDPIVDFEGEGERHSDLTALDLMPYAIRYGRQELRDGVTTVRIMGERQWMDFYYKAAFDADVVPGPRIIPSGPALTITGGYANEISVQVDGVDEVRKAVRKNLMRGAQVIKLFLSGGITVDQPKGLTMCYFSEEEIRVAIEEAHKHGVKVAAHLNGGDGVRYGLKYGLDCIEHGSELTESEIDLVVKAGAYVAPTLLWPYIKLWVKNLPYLREEEGKQTKRLYDAGVKLVCGNDCIHNDHGMARQIDLMTQWGIPPMDAILTATKTAAEACGIASERGTLEAGKDADIIAVGGNPLSDIRALRDVRLVMKAGKVYPNL